MKRRLLTIILIILVAFSLASCGIEVKKAGTADNNQKSSLEDPSGNKEDNAQGNETGEKDETGETDEPAEPGKIKESDLSEKYRIDLVPIFKGSVIFATMDDPNHKTYSLGCYSKKTYKEVKAYYKKLMSNYDIESEEEDDDPFSSDPTSYSLEAFVNDDVYVAFKLIDLTDIPEDELDRMHFEDFEMPKDAKTMFSLRFYNFEE